MEYKVYLTGWEGMRDTEGWTPYAVCNTLKEALAVCEYAWEEELAPDEGAYIYHNGILKEDWEWKKDN